MTISNLIKKKEHLEKLISGAVKTGNPTRDSLIQADAQRHLDKMKEKLSKRQEDYKKVFGVLKTQEKSENKTNSKTKSGSK